MSPFSATDPVTFATADAMQAAYFRGFLDDERHQLIADIAKREAEVVKRVEAGQPVGHRTVAHSEARRRGRTAATSTD